MKRITVLLFVLGMSFNLFSQMQIPELVFVFESQNDFTEQFSDNDNSKELTFKIEGIDNSVAQQALLNLVKKTRGVESFIMEEGDDVNQFEARIIVYKYATNWRYWETFMRMVGVPNFKIGNDTFNKEEIKALQ